MILNRKNAETIFSHNGPHNFMSKGGTKITSSGSMDVANPELSFVANKAIINKKATVLSSAHTSEAPRLQMLMLDNERISGDMETIDPVKAKDMLDKAENEVTAKKMLETKYTKTY